MKERRTISRFADYAEEVAAAVRRRKETRKPRVRVRVEATEARVLTEGSEEHDRLLAICQALVDQERSAPHG